MEYTLKRFSWFLLAAVVAVIAYVVLFHADWLVIPPFERVSALSLDKFDGDCTGHETVGRCADKCPAATNEGAYYLQGFDKETGAAVCGFTYYDPCPYADAQPATSPTCQRLAATATQPVASPSEAFHGK